MLRCVLFDCQITDSLCLTKNNGFLPVRCDLPAMFPWEEESRCRQMTADREREHFIPPFPAIKSSCLCFWSLTCRSFCRLGQLQDTDHEHHNKKSPFASDLHVPLTHPGKERKGKLFQIIKKILIWQRSPTESFLIRSHFLRSQKNN